MKYGLPYQGSKNAIAKEIIEALPAGARLVDLFGGGGAITHAAMLNGKYKSILYNDINTLITSLFKDAVDGKYNPQNFIPEWISRKQFSQLKDTDGYIKYCWSFGNKGYSYLYSKEIEPWKKALHYARVYKDFSLFAQFGIITDGSYVDIKAHKDEYKKKYIRWYMDTVLKYPDDYEETFKKLQANIEADKEELRNYLLDALKDSELTQSEVQKRLGTQMAGHYFGRSQWSFPTMKYYKQMQTFMPKLDKDYEELIGLQRLWQSLESLQSLQSLEISNIDYRDYKHQEGDVVYCDIPYETEKSKESCDYGLKFDWQAFYKWAQEQPFTVYFSSYYSESLCNLAEVVWSKEKYNLMCSTNGSRLKQLECLYKVV